MRLCCTSRPAFSGRVISDKLRGNILLKQHVLEVDLRHVSLFNDELAHVIQDRPADVLPLVCVPSPSHECKSLFYLNNYNSLKMLRPRLHEIFYFP